MKRILIILTLITVLGVSIIGCGNNASASSTSNNTVTENSASKDNGNTKEDSEKIKLEAVEANYKDIVDGKYANKIIWVEGEVITTKDGSFPDFDLKVKNGNDFETYKILNAESLEGLKQGDKVKVYGTVTDSKTPVIEASTIDKE